jgi:hypothetical protein
MSLRIDTAAMFVVVAQGGADHRSSTMVAKSASRIALYMMREEMRENPLERGEKIR